MRLKHYFSSKTKIHLMYIKDYNMGKNNFGKGNLLRDQ